MGLNAAEQYLLELINRTRLDPRGEIDRLNNSGLDKLAKSGAGLSTLSGKSLDPLAGNNKLARAADDHVDWMLRMDRFSHTGAGGSNAGSRIDQEGYNSKSWAENIAFRGLTQNANMKSHVEVLHRNLFESEGHRDNLLSAGMREVGSAVGVGDFQGLNAAMVAQNFARGGDTRFVTGVVYQDKDDDGFYSIGEGKKGIGFKVAGNKTDSERAGGYSVSMGQDGHKPVVTVEAGNNKMRVKIEDKSGNVKLDLVDGNTLASSSSLNLKAGAKNAMLLGIDKLSLRGNDARNKLVGNDSKNLIVGHKGNDKLFGEGGADLLLGNVGRDHISGGNGKDKILGGKHGDRLFGNDGQDRLFGQGGNDTMNGGSGKDKLDGGNGRDALYGGHGADRLLGGKKGDVLFGGGGADKLLGHNGRDRIAGGDGNDRISGGKSNDRLFGNDGQDRVLGNGGNDVINGGIGQDTLGGGDGSDRLFGGNGDDKLLGGRKDDSLFGGGGADDLRGENGDDVLYGQDGDDRASGGNGNDKIYGGAGDDTLRGNYGNDLIDGGAGDDILDGGLGSDVFVFRANDGHDVVNGFDVSLDQIVLDTGLWDGTRSQQDVVAEFAAVTTEGIVFDFGDETILFVNETDIASFADQMSFI